MTQPFPPHPILTPYVDAFLAISHYFETKVHQTLSARGVPMLVFPFKNPSATTFRHGITQTEYPNLLMNQPALLSADNEYAHSTFEGSVNFIMVMLKPTGAYHLLRSNVKGMANKIETMEQLGLHRHFDMLQEKLWLIQQPANAVALIQHFLLGWFAQRVEWGAGDFSPVLNYMFRHPVGLTVYNLAKKFKCSER